MGAEPVSAAVVAADWRHLVHPFEDGQGVPVRVSPGGGLFCAGVIPHGDGRVVALPLMPTTQVLAVEAAEACSSRSGPGT
jgi:hypothetical protein